MIIGEDKKAEIWKDNKDKYGVYRWIYTLNGSSYVGSSTVLKKKAFLKVI